MTARAFAPYELPSLIEAVLSSKDGGNAIGRLRGVDAQTFVDVIDEARSTFTHHHEIRLIEIYVETFRQLGVEWSMSFAALESKEMCQITV